MEITEQGTKPGQTEVLGFDRDRGWIFRFGRGWNEVEVTELPKSFRPGRGDKIVVQFVESPTSDQKSGKAKFVATWHQFQDFALQTDVLFETAYPNPICTERRQAGSYESLTGVLYRLQCLSKS